MAVVCFVLGYKNNLRLWTKFRDMPNASSGFPLGVCENTVKDGTGAVKPGIHEYTDLSVLRLVMS